MRVNKEVQQGAQLMTLVQQKASVEYCDPDCDDSRLLAIVIAKCCVCVLLLIVFYHPSLILYKSLFHSYLRAIAATDLVFLIYNLMYGAFVCQGLSDPPREVKARRTAAIRLTGYRTGDEPGAGGVAEVHLRPPDAAVRPLRLPGPYLLPPAGLS